jgi:NAD(P)-dependent dehydrogenase (short-subunit alcohol dehydrogenase family)
MTSGLALVVGGSSPIGSGIAEALAAEGRPVVLTWHQGSSAAEACVQRITSRGGRATAFGCDVRDPASIVQLFDQAVAWADGPPTALVAAAGIWGQRAPLTQFDDAMLRAIVETNLLGTLLCCREAAQRMAPRNGGQGGGIVSISSTAGTFGGNLLTPYAATKAAINVMTLALAREVAADGIRVNAVSPGVIDGDGLDGLSDAERATLARSVPLGRIGTPEDVARAVVWSLSDAAAYVTGVVLPVHGGR